MPLFGIFNIAVSFLLIITFPLVCKVTKDHWDDNRYAAISGLAAGFSMLIAGIYMLVRSIPVFYWSITATTQAETEMAFILSTLQPIPFPFSSFVFYFGCFVMTFLMAFWAIELKRKKYLDAKEVELEVDSLDIEVSRKLFHICIIGVIVCYLLVGKLVSEAVFDTVYTLFNQYFSGTQAYYINPVTLSARNMGQGVTIFIFMAIFILIFFTDLIRIYRFRFYPLKELAYVYRNKERSVLGPHVYLLGGALFAVVLFPGPIAISAIAMAGFGDAMATITGVSIGKHKLKPLGKYESNKTWEGCIGGIIGSMAFGTISYIFVGFVWYADVGLSPVNIIVTGLILNAIGTLVFFLADYFTPPLKISDNILNPTLIPFVQFIVAVLLFPYLIV
ncbi:MAG: hypothetical protein EAX96_18885 [Candidatus Lokiarchaeota archaeon]|nr:hypothetical protein [Candidatus Lokiarchaeota archaeon]